MRPPIKLKRRAFLAGLGAGLAVGVMPRARADEPTGRAGNVPPPQQESRGGLSPQVLIHIALDGTTTIICHRSEMGQGVRSSIPVLIGDEIGADPKRVIVQQAEGDKKYGDQNTDGSSSIRKQYDGYRRAGAAARMMLVAAAAKRWGVKAETCTTANHFVIHTPSKRSIAFAEVVEAAAKLPVPKDKDIVLRPFAELTHVADPKLPLIDGTAFVMGTAQFGADTKLPNLAVAMVARPPVVGGKVSKYDATRALAVPGVRKVIEMPVPKPPWNFQPWGGIAVVADNTWAALKGRAALDITWDEGPNRAYDSSAYREQLLASVRAPGTTYRNRGDVDAAFAKAQKTVEAEYVVPHLCHMQMEPLVAVAQVKDGRAEVWAPTQNPQANRADVAKILGLPEDKVTINVTLLGGAFGRKSKSDFVSEAAFIAKQLEGQPVRLQWTREDDVKHGYYNAVNAQRLRVALDDQGQVNAWHHRTAFTPIGGIFNVSTDTPGAKDLQQGVLDVALASPNVRVEACKAPLHTRVGWYRSVYNIFHGFAIGSFIDEIAHARGADPKQTWLDVIGPARQVSLAELGVEKLGNYDEPLDDYPVDAGRLRNVIERVTDNANWSKRDGRALGLAAHRSFVSYTAVVISVVPDPARVFRIDDAWIAMDAGTIVNQDRVRAQMEGGVVMGISNALYGGVTMTNGATDQTNYRDARVARIGDVPRRIHTDLIRSTDPPCGVGEPPVPPVAAAVANAIFALTGKRIREIPLLKGLKA